MAERDDAAWILAMVEVEQERGALPPGGASGGAPRKGRCGMGEDDLIRRGDAVRACEAAARSYAESRRTFAPNDLGHERFDAQESTARELADELREMPAALPPSDAREALLDGVSVELTREELVVLLEAVAVERRIQDDPHGEAAFRWAAHRLPAAARVRVPLATFVELATQTTANTLLWPLALSKYATEAVARKPR